MTFDFSIVKAALSVVFFCIPFAVLTGYFVRRRKRLDGASFAAQRPTWRTLVWPLLLTCAVGLGTSMVVDGLWDELRLSHEIPLRTLEVLLLTSLAEAGLLAVALCFAVAIIELFDHMRSA